MKRSRRSALLALTWGVSTLSSATLLAQTCGVEQSCGVESCDSPQRTHRCAPCSNQGLLDRLDDFACRLPQLPQRRQSILSAFKVELSLNIRSGKHCKSGDCSAEPTCGIEPTCGTETPCAAEPTCGVEPSCGLESEPTCGLEQPKRRRISSFSNSCKCGTPACTGCASGIREETVTAIPRSSAPAPYAGQIPVPKAPVAPKPPLPRPVDTKSRDTKAPLSNSIPQPHVEPPIGTAVKPDVPELNATQDQTVKTQQPVKPLPKLPPAPGLDSTPALREVPRELPIRTPNIPKSDSQSEDAKTDPFGDDAKNEVKWKQRTTQPASHDAAQSGAGLQLDTKYGDAFDPQAADSTNVKTQSKRLVLGGRGSSRTVPKTIVELLSERASALQSEVVQASALVALPSAAQLRPIPTDSAAPLPPMLEELTPINPLR